MGVQHWWHSDKQFNMELVVLTILLLFLRVNCFYIKISDTGLSLTAGESFTLTCTADHYWEYCKFRSPGGESCDFEWKYNKGNVSRTSCAGLEDRAFFSGDFSSHSQNTGQRQSSPRPERGGRGR